MSSCPTCGVPGEPHTDIYDCVDALIAYYAPDTGRCVCGAPEPCLAPSFGGRHVAPEVWVRYEAVDKQNDKQEKSNAENTN